MKSREHLQIRPWIVWGLGALFGLYTFLLQGTPSVMIPQLIDTYKIDVVKIGVLTSSFFYTYIILQIPAGIIVDLFGPRRVLKISFFFCSLAVFWFAFSHFFWEGQVSRMMMGITTAPAIICAFCLASRWFKPYLFTLLVSLTEFTALAGGVIGEGGLAISVAKFGWRETMILVGVVGLIMTILSFFIIHDYPDHDQPLHQGMSFRDLVKKTGRALVEVLSIRQIWMNGIYGGLVFGLFPAFAALWGVPYFSLRYGISIELSALIASMFFIGACFGTLTLGWASVYITRRKPIMLTASFIAFLFSLSVIYIPGIPLPLMFILVLLFGYFCSSYALCFALAGHYVSKEKKGVAMGFTNTLCIAFGAPILQPLIGYLLKKGSDGSMVRGLGLYSPDDYLLALSPLPICLLLAFLLAFFVREKSHHEEG